MQEPISASGAKERPTAENSDVLHGNFDLSVIDHIRQLENPHYCYICRHSYVTAATPVDTVM